MRGGHITVLLPCSSPPAQHAAQLVRLSCCQGCLGSHINRKPYKSGAWVLCPLHGCPAVHYCEGYQAVVGAMLSMLSWVLCCLGCYAVYCAAVLAALYSLPCTRSTRPPAHASRSRARCSAERGAALHPQQYTSSVRCSAVFSSHVTTPAAAQVIVTPSAPRLLAAHGVAALCAAMYGVAAPCAAICTAWRLLVRLYVRRGGFSQPLA
jgi:hypothetical protein